MRLLIFTQVLDEDDSNLGFFHDWILGFSKKFEIVSVICLKKGKYNLPDNVHVYSLEKERGVSRARYVYLFYKYIFMLLPQYDSVFIHMSQIYVIMGGIFWKILNKKIGLWYAHGKVSPSLRLATYFADFVFTSSSMGYRINNKKRIILGQGINIERFKPKRTGHNFNRNCFKIVSVGRISSVKNYEVLISSVKKVINSGFCVHLQVVGDPITAADKKYYESLRNIVVMEELGGAVTFSGGVSQSYVPSILNESDLLINLSNTGSLDKAVLEAMATELIILTSNPAFSDDQFKLNKCNLYIEKAESNLLAERIIKIILTPEDRRIAISKEICKIINTDHSLSKLVDNISILLSK